MQRGSPQNHLAGTARVQKFYDRTTLRHRVRMTPSPNDEKGARRRDGHRAASRSTRTTKSGDRPMRGERSRPGEQPRDAGQIRCARLTELILGIENMKDVRTLRPASARVIGTASE